MRYLYYHHSLHIQPIQDDLFITPSVNPSHEDDMQRAGVILIRASRISITSPHSIYIVLCVTQCHKVAIFYTYFRS